MLIVVGLGSHKSPVYGPRKPVPGSKTSSIRQGEKGEFQYDDQGIDSWLIFGRDKQSNSVKNGRGRRVRRDSAMRRFLRVVEPTMCLYLICYG